LKKQELLKSNFKGEVTNEQLDSVQAKQNSKAKSKQVKPQYGQLARKSPQESPRKRTLCIRCGDTKGHNLQQCPARDAICNRCHKKGHYARMCKSRKVYEVNIATLTADTNEDIAFLGSLMTKEAGSPWMTKIKMDNFETMFKIDTGADVTAVPVMLYNQGQFNKLKPPGRILQGPGGVSPKVKGKFTATLSKHNTCTKQDIYVVDGLYMPLLGRPAVMALQLVARLDDVGLTSKERVEKEFPKLFSGLGKMEGEYNIVLKPDAKPFSLSTPRRISLPLLPKVKEELKRMEQQGVISKVEEPTEWCAPMVVVPKRTGKVRICTDLTELNKSVMREKHPLPSVESNLGQLAGAKVFSKLDANAGFWQIPLSKESSLLTTFITPFGRYCYNRLFFGISSAPEHFQKRMSRILV